MFVIDMWGLLVPFVGMVVLPMLSAVFVPMLVHGAIVVVFVLVLM